MKVTPAMFDDRFEAVLADTPEACQIHYRIRFLVYCLETGYEDAFAYPDGLESDQWDERSAHFLVRRRDDGAWIAAMRLVLPDGDRPLPIQTLCKLDRRVSRDVPDHRIAEVSRLCMVERYRRRTAERHIPYEIVDSDPGRRHQVLPFTVEKRSAQRRHGSEIMLGLLRAAAEYGIQRGVDHWFFLTSPVLCRMLERYGIPFVPAGEPCQHNGERHPFFVDLSRTWSTLRSSGNDMSAWLDGSQPAFRLYSEIQAASRISQPRKASSVA